MHSWQEKMLRDVGGRVFDTIEAGRLSVPAVAEIGYELARALSQAEIISEFGDAMTKIQAFLDAPEREPVTPGWTQTSFTSGSTRSVVETPKPPPLHAWYVARPLADCELPGGRFYVKKPEGVADTVWVSDGGQHAWLLSRSEAAETLEIVRTPAGVPMVASDQERIEARFHDEGARARYATERNARIATGEYESEVFAK